MSIRVDSSSLITGAVVVGVPGLGVLAESVPSTGEHGAGYLYPSLEFPADNGKEVRGLITTWPTQGTLTAFEDSSFEYDGASDTFAFQMYVDGVAVGAPQTVTITVGAGATYNDTLSESVATAESVSGLMTFSGAISETVSLLDQLSTGNVFNETHAAAVTPEDSLASAATLSASLAEAVTLLDASSNGSLYNEVLAASVSLSDVLASTATLTGTIAESAALSDEMNALADFQATLTEGVTAGDLVATQAEQATLPRKALTARITALSFSARVDT